MPKPRKQRRDEGRGMRDERARITPLPHPSPLAPSHHPPLTTHHSRSGLAPLEMVLSLPILLFIMALIINFGALASWKVRGLSAARHAVWSSRWPRTRSAFPRPTYWLPPESGMGAVAAGDVAELDDPRVDLPVVRGPLPSGFVVNERLLDPARGLRRGNALREDDYPLLPGIGPYDLTAEHRFLDDKWQYQRTNWPAEGARLPVNAWRRIPVIYRLPQVSPGLVSAYLAAANAILSSPTRADLGPLETWKDDEYIDYSLRFGWPLTRRDFHPRLRRFCSLSSATAAERAQSVVDRVQGRGRRGDPGWIPGVAWELTRARIALYRRVIRELTARISAVPPPSAAEIASMTAEIADLEAKIEVLEEFQTRLERDEI